MSARKSSKGRRSAESIRAYRVGVSFFLLLVFAFLFAYAGIGSLGEETYENKTAEATTSEATTTPTVPVRVATHISTPSPVRAVYMTSCVAATPSLRENLVKLIDDTEINSVVVDIKTFDGYISFMPKSKALKDSVGGCYVKGMQDFVDELHAHGIYVIGRIASFQDQLRVKQHPELAVKKETSTTTVWRDYKGIAWIDTGSTDQWSYLASIAKEAHNIGFDEINFDYIRFPADGDMKDIWYPISEGKNKAFVVRSFYEYIHKTMAEAGITTSGDIFGMTTTNTDDLGIGQILEYALPNFDYVMPMTYPSHYPNGFFGLGDPNKNVYQVIKISLDHAIERALATTTVEEIDGARIGTSTPAIYAKPVEDIGKIRPWLQDNNYPVPYTPEMVAAQIKAAADAGISSWGLWNAGNKYTKSVLLTEQKAL